MKTFDQIYEENKADIWDSDVLSNWQAKDLAIQFALEVLHEIKKNIGYYAGIDSMAARADIRHFNELRKQILDDK